MTSRENAANRQPTLSKGTPMHRASQAFDAVMPSLAEKLHQGKHGMKMGANSQENINRNLTRIFRGQIDFKDFSYM